MSLPFKIFYSLEELVEHGWCDFSSVDEILHVASTGFLPVHTFVDNCYYLSTYQSHFKKMLGDMENEIDISTITSYAGELSYDYNESLAQVPEYAIRRMIMERSSVVVTDYYFAANDKSKTYDKIIVSVDLKESAAPLPVSLKISDLVVTIETVKDIDNEYPSLSDTCSELDGHRCDLLFQKLLDTNHNWYSKDLALAVKAWLALYADHEGHRNSNEFKPHGGHKEMIAEWLKENYGKQTNPTLRERLADVVSPCDLSGPAKCKKWHKQ